MRKRLITPSPQAGTLHDEGWLDLDREAVVELTSEEKEYPVEAALVAGEKEVEEYPVELSNVTVL